MLAMNKMNKFYLLIFIPVILLAISCKSGKEKKSQIASIDSLKVKLDQMDLKLHEITIHDVNKRFNEYKKTMNSVIQEVKAEVDTLSGVYLMAYARVRMPFKAFIKSLPRLQHDVDSTKNRLNGLINDVQKNQVKKDKYEEYFKQESYFVNKLDYNVNKYVDECKAQMISFDTLDPKIQEIIEKYKGKK